MVYSVISTVFTFTKDFTMSPTEHFELSNLQPNAPVPVPVDPILEEFKILEKRFFEISARNLSHKNFVEKANIVTNMVALRNKDSIGAVTSQTIYKAVQRILGF